MKIARIAFSAAFRRPLWLGSTATPDAEIIDGLLHVRLGDNVMVLSPSSWDYVEPLGCEFCGRPRSGDGETCGDHSCRAKLRHQRRRNVSRETTE